VHFRGEWGHARRLRRKASGPTWRGHGSHSRSLAVLTALLALAGCGSSATTSRRSSTTGVPKAAAAMPPTRVTITFCYTDSSGLEHALLQIDGARPEPSDNYQAILEFVRSDGTSDPSTAEFVVARDNPTSVANAVGESYGGSFVCRLVQVVDHAVRGGIGRTLAVQGGMSISSGSAPAEPSSATPTVTDESPSAAPPATAAHLTPAKLCALLPVKVVAHLFPAAEASVGSSSAALHAVSNTITVEATKNVSCAYNDAYGGTRLSIVVATGREAKLGPLLPPSERLTVSGLPALYSSNVGRPELDVQLDGAVLAILPYPTSDSPYRPAVPANAPIPPQYLALSRAVAGEIIAGLN